MKRLLSLFFAVILLFSVVPLNAFAAEELTVETETADPVDLPVEEESEVPVLLASGDVTLTGTIQLPDGGTAPSKTYFTVSYETEDASDYFRGYFAAGATSASWSITLPADSVVKYLIIHISEPHLLGVLGNYRYLSGGFVAGGSGSLSMTASELAESDLDLTLTPGTPVQIDVSLPDGYEVTGDEISVEASVQIEDGGKRTTYWGSGWFDVGQTETTFYIMLPVSDTMVIRRITLEVYDADGLLPELYYQEDGTWSSEYATLEFSQDEVRHLGATLQASSLITGTVSLPEGAELNGQTVGCVVEATTEDSDSYHSDYLNLSADSATAPFTINVPVAADQYVLSLQCYDVEGTNLLSFAYYVEPGVMSTDGDDAAWVKNATSGHELSAMIGESLSGTLSFAEGSAFTLAEDSDYAHVRIIATSKTDRTVYSTSVSVTTPDTYQWTLTVPDDSKGYTLRVYVPGDAFETSNICSDVHLYYGADGSLGSEANAAAVNAGDVLDLVIPLQTIIPLTISCPEGAWIKNGSVQINISAGPVGASSTSCSSSFEISDPTQPVNAELPVPNDGDYWIRVSLYPVTDEKTGVQAETNLKTRTTLYWNESGWVSDSNLATGVPTDGTARTLTLPLADEIPLQVVLGEGTILEGDYNLWIYLINENGSGRSYDFAIHGETGNTTLLDDTIWYTGAGSAFKVYFRISRVDTGLHDTNVQTGEYLFLKEDGSFTSSQSEACSFPLETLKSGLTLTLQKERTLSGQFILPDSYISDSAEHEFCVCLSTSSSTKYEYFYVQPDGTFRIVLPVSEYNGLYTATFSPCENLEGVITEEIVYADADGEPIPLDLTKSNDITDVAIALRGGAIMSGTMILPDDLTYEQNAYVSAGLYVQPVDSDSTYYASEISMDFETAGSGGQEIPFSLSVPTDIGSFRLRYTVSGENTNLLKDTFYVTADGGYTTNADDAGIFTLDTAPTQITAPTGTLVSLQMKLPSGAEKGSYYGWINIYDETGTQLENQTTYFGLYSISSKTITLCLPKELTRFYLSYQLNSAADSTILTGKQLYCKADGTLVASLEDAELLDIAQLPAITFGLKEDFGKTIYGTISFGEGLTYTSEPGSAYVYFYLPDESYLGSVYVTFDSSSNSYSYSYFTDRDDVTDVIVVFRIYNVSDANITAGQYYYSDSGTVKDISEATAVPVETGSTEVSFEIPTIRTTLTGKLTAAADSAYTPVITGTRNDVTIYLTSENGSSKSFTASLAEDFSFSINIPTEDCGTYTKASVSLDVSGVDNIRPGTYSYETPFTLTENETTDIEIPIQLGMPVYADVSRPENTTGYERFTLHFNSAQDSVSLYFDISSSQTTRQVLLPLMTDVGYKVSLQQYSSRHDNVCELYCGMLYLTADNTLTIFSENAAARDFQSGERLALTAIAPATSVFQFTDVDEYAYGSVYAETVDGSYTNSSSLEISKNSRAFFSDLIPPEMIGEDLLIAYSLNTLGYQKIYINPDGTYTLDRSKAVSHRIEEENYFKIGVLKDATAPTASISNGSALQSTVNYGIRFDASASTDNFGIRSYEWDFGDGSTGWGSTAIHEYSAAGDYTVTLTVTDYSGNTATATIPVTILSPNDGSIAAFSVKDTMTTASISNAQITITADSGKQFHLRTDNNGEVYLALEPGDYTVQAASSSYEPRTFRFTKEADKKQSFTIYMNSSDLLTITTTVKEMNLDEIKNAGIDTTNPDNQHVYECIAVFEFGPVVYHYNGAGEIVGDTTAPGGIEVIPVAKDVYLVVKSETRWLKEMFQVSLIVNNTSAVERIEGLTANLELPDGLSLAAMLPGYAAQTNEVVIGSVEPQASSQTDWYLCGDAEGTYYLNGSVTGVRVGGGVREDIQANFRTKDPIVVLAGSAMQLTIEAERYATVGTPYKLRYTLENVSGKTLYNVSLNVLGGKFYNEFPYTALEYLPGEDLGGTYSPDDGILSVEEFKPGDVLSGTFTITFAEGIETDYIHYMLERFFSLTGNGSTTTIPTTIRYFHNWDEGTVVQAPTCTEKGVMRYTCLDDGCGETKDEPISALGHDYQAVVTPPTCTEQGYTTHTCTRCGDSYVDTYVNALGHSFTNYSYNNDATCTEDGTETAACDRDGCTAVDTRKKADTALGHSFTNYVSDGNATCTQDGTKTAQCDHGCGTTDTIPDEGSMLEHTYDEGVVTVEPTLESEGVRTFTCLVCGHEKTEVLPKLTHQDLLVPNISVEKTYGNTDFYITVLNRSSGGGELSYQSSNESVITLTPGPTSCKVHIVGAGEATVTVTAAPVSLKYAETTATVTITVKKAALTVTAQDLTISYADAAPTAYQYAAEGFVLSETAEQVLTGTAAYSCSYQPYDKVGSYPITVSGLTAANYEITFVPGQLTVERAAAMLKIIPESLIWRAAEIDDAEKSAIQTTVTPADPTAQVSVEYQIGDTWGAARPTAPGKYPVRVWLASSDNLVVPTTPDYVTGTLEIKPDAFISVGDDNVYVEIDKDENGGVEIKVEDPEDIVANSTGDVTVDLTGNEASASNGLTLPGDLINAMDESENVESFTVKTQDTELTMDSDVLNTVAEAMETTDKLTVRIDTVDQENLTPDQQEALAAINAESGDDNVVVLDLRLIVTAYDGEGNQVGSRELHELNGLVNVRAKYEKTDPDSILIGIYVDENGVTTYLPVVYEDGYISFVTDHFSVYALMEVPPMNVSVKQADSALNITVENANTMNAKTAIISAYDKNGKMLACTEGTIDSPTYTTTLERCADAVTVKVFVLDAKSVPMMRPICWTK